MNLDERIAGAKHFYWNEAIKPGDEFPNNTTIIKNIMDCANNLELARTYLGSQPMYITSWYRSPERNRRVKGARNSQHLTGLAVDFYCKHLSPILIYDKLDNWKAFIGGLGLYRSHIHIDFRGSQARWKRLK